MKNEKYISYLNSLHNYNAQNPNAYGEKNVGNEFYQKVAVKVGLCTYIENQLCNEKPHVLILTGHAGDGKTSIMYQVLKDFNVDFNADEKISEIVLPTGNKCRCIKDYSELSDTEKLNILKECMLLPKKGEFVFMVSNTGPLINTFGELFPEEDRETAKIELIDAMDENAGEVKEICGYKIGIINIALIDNTRFAVSFVNNIIDDSLWVSCSECEKRSYCHIRNNRELIVKNKQRVFEFIHDHYIWLVEHGTRLTIRSMTEQLAYMITGGVECNQVVPTEKNKYLFFNLFLGYIGLKNNERADTILAIREAKQCAYDKKRLRADEKLMIDCNYSTLFGNEMNDILIESYKKDGYISGWVEFLRRAYIFTNIETNSENKSRDSEDIFSRHFERYLQLRSGQSKPAKADTNLIVDALSMMYLGRIADNSTSEIPITLNKTSGLTQNVQLVTGSIPTRKLSLIQKETKDSIFDPCHKRFELRLQVDKIVLDNVISLPMLDYFEELRNGVISTNIDPQLSHGVESLKAQLTEEYNDEDDNVIEIIVLRNNKNIHYRLELYDSGKIRNI
jgi:hypothetical protein